MKFATDRPYADPEAAARKLLKRDDFSLNRFGISKSVDF
jgi:hypothetical protein